MIQRTLAIVGRPNVGKSALFNRIAGKQISLVFDRPGVTRDRIVATCKWGPHVFTLVDTGGIGLEDSEGFSEAIAQEAEIALTTADDILFVVDGREGLTPLDREVARRLRKARRPVWVVVNKIDDDKQAHLENEFAVLGFGQAWPVSAAHGRGIDDLMDAVTEQWPESEQSALAKPEQATRVAIVGRPNVGKSSLINALIKSDRTMVSDIPGTTRDAVDIPYEYQGKPYLLIDTAGMRQERRIHDELESRMTGRTVHTINRAEVCVLVIDAEKGVSMQEKKIAGLIQEAHCPCVIVVNKWDIVRDQGDGGKQREREYYEALQNDLFFVNYAPVVFLSAKTGERLQGLLSMIEQIAQNRRYRFQTGPLNRVLHKAIERYAPPTVRGKRFKILYAAQQIDDDRRQIPTLILFVNNPKLLTPAYQRYLELQIRDSFKLTGCPLKFIMRSREQREGIGRSANTGQRKKTKR